MIKKQDVLTIIDSYIHEIITESGKDKNAHTNKILRQIKSDIDNIPTSEQVLDEIRAEIAQERVGYPPSAGEYKVITKCLKIIDEYRKE